MPGELRAVAAAELVPTCRIVAEPRAQLRAWCDLLDPFVEPGFRLADPSRPQAVNEDSCAVGFLRRFIGPLQPDVRSGNRARGDLDGLRELVGGRAPVAGFADRALELDFGEQTLMIAVHDRNRLLAPLPQIADRAVALLDRAIDHDFIPIFRVTDIGNSEVMLLGPEEGDGIERLTPADHVAPTIATFLAFSALAISTRLFSSVRK